MKIPTKTFRIKDHRPFKLTDWPTLVDPFYASKKQYEDSLADGVEKLSAQQKLLYASNEYSLLILFQAMDAAGKDSVIKHVMSGINPQGCQVYSFKHPSTEELDHDFLWRTTKCLPERGRIGIFNRSYYEEVLVARVHPEILKAERIPALAGSESVWRERYESIVDFEKHLHRNGTRIVKFFLHLSKEEQRKRFLARIDNPEKNWKFSADDLREREYWNEYQRAYELCIAATSTESAPWYVVPADDKKNTRLIVSQVILETMQALEMSYPQTDKKRQAELSTLRKRLMK